MKILIAGLQHETNTFSPIPATYDDFVKADLWPKLLINNEMIPVLDGVTLPITGFIHAAKADGHELIPALWCSAEPSGKVQDSAFEKIIDILIPHITANPDIDAVYLDLHGAMVTDHYDDAEGELLARVRREIRPNIPIAISLDFHANVTQAMVDLSDVISIYRTYPHIDMIETGERAYHYLQRWFNGELRFKSFRQIPYLIPLSSQCTDDAPNKELFEYLNHLQSAMGLGIELALGFPPADIADAGPAIVAYSHDKNTLEDATQRLFDAVLKREVLYKDNLYTPYDAITLGLLTSDDKPVILADVQDNSGAGATSDTTGVLSTMISEGVKGAIVSAICDPQLIANAHLFEEGAEFTSPIGNHFNYDSKTLVARWRVLRLSDGRFTCSGEMYGGSVADVGSLALLQLVDPNSDIKVIVSRDRFQCVDRSVFEHLGVKVEKYRFVVLKSTVHFRADFAPIAARMIQVESAGAHPCKLTNLDYQKLREGVRLMPCGPTFKGKTHESS